MGLTFEVIDEPDLTLPEDRIFRAVLMEIKEHRFDWVDYKQSPPEPKTSTILQWWFEVQTTDEYNGRRVKLETDPKLSNNPRNRFRAAAEALLNRQIGVGTKLDTDDMVGLPVDITIRHQADKKDPSKKYERVDDLIPVGDSYAADSEPPF